MLAFARMEPFGPLREDYRFGQIAAIVANVNRDPQKSEPFYPKHFFPELDPVHSDPQPAVEGQVSSGDEPILLDDPQKQADLIRLRIFGHQPGTMKPRKSNKHG